MAAITADKSADAPSRGNAAMEASSSDFKTSMTERAKAVRNA
jgi:hypothetical protein